MQNLKSTLHKLDTKIHTLVEGVIENPFDSKKIIQEENAIQKRIKRYRKYKKWTAFAVVCLASTFILTLIFGKEYLEEIVFYDFFLLGVMLLLTYPFHYIFEIKVEKLQTALYLKKLKSHLEEVIQEPVLQPQNNNEATVNTNSFLNPFSE